MTKSFAGLLQEARDPTECEKEEVEGRILPKLEGKFWLMLGEETPLNSKGVYNCFGWAIQMPNEVIDLDNMDAEFPSEEFVEQTLLEKGYVKTANKKSAVIEVCYDEDDNIVHFTRFYDLDGDGKRRYASKLGSGGPLIVHLQGAINGDKFGVPKEYYEKA